MTNQDDQIGSLLATYEQSLNQRRCARGRVHQADTAHFNTHNPGRQPGNCVTYLPEQSTR